MAAFSAASAISSAARPGHAAAIAKASPNPSPRAPRAPSAHRSAAKSSAACSARSSAARSGVEPKDRVYWCCSHLALRLKLAPWGYKKVEWSAFKLTLDASSIPVLADADLGLWPV